MDIWVARILPKESLKNDRNLVYVCLSCLAEASQVVARVSWSIWSAVQYKSLLKSCSAGDRYLSHYP